MYKFLSFFIVLHTACHVLNYFSINLGDTKEDITLQGFLLSSKNIELVTLYQFYSLLTAAIMDYFLILKISKCKIIIKIILYVFEIGSTLL